MGVLLVEDVSVLFDMICVGSNRVVVCGSRVLQQFDDVHTYNYLCNIRFSFLGEMHPFLILFTF